MHIVLLTCTYFHATYCRTTSRHGYADQTTAKDVLISPFFPFHCDINQHGCHFIKYHKIWSLNFFIKKKLKNREQFIENHKICTFFSNFIREQVIEIKHRPELLEALENFQMSWKCLGPGKNSSVPIRKDNSLSAEPTMVHYERCF